jgi:hypothetical protein
MVACQSPTLMRHNLQHHSRSLLRKGSEKLAQQSIKRQCPHPLESNVVSRSRAQKRALLTLMKGEAFMSSSSVAPSGLSDWAPRSGR